MPFTASHPAAVLPLLRRRRWVSAGLVTGSIAPDVPSFVPLGLEHDQTHPLHAILWPDGLLAIGVLVAWWVLLRPGLAPLWPAAAARLGPSGWRAAPVTEGRRRLAVWAGWLAASLLVGMATHLLWDSCTHSDGVVVQHWALLGRWVGGHRIFDWLQALSSVVGLAVVVAWLARAWPSGPRPEPVEEPVEAPLGRPARWLVVGGTLAAVVLAGSVEWHRLSADHAGHLLLASGTSKAAGAALVTCLGAWSLIWALRQSVRREAPHNPDPVGVP